MGSLSTQELDALIVGAGFGGIYELHLLRSLGLKTKVIDRAGDVGGTWYWNRYPGAMSDTESYVYRFSWDKELLQYYPWKEHYVKQPESLAYLEHVVERHNLRKDMVFNTELLGTSWDDATQLWHIETSTGITYTARYLITALGTLSEVNFPKIKGVDTFGGVLYHTARWPAEYNFAGKRVAVIGNGSTGVQVITALGLDPEVKEIVSYQRTPQYSVPSGDGPVSAEYRKWVNENYDQIWDGVRKSQVGFGFKESTTPAMSVSAKERERIYQEAWDRGNGFRFMFAFNDIPINEEANLTACDFIKRKIAETVKDPEKRRKLMPSELYARRPLCDNGYYKTFNQDRVDVVSLKETPIEEITPTGIKTANGVEREFDAIIFATGFDAVDGNYTRKRFHGRDGDSLKDHWSMRPSSYLGLCVPNYPNFFMISGPMGPFANQPPGIELECEFIRDLITQAEKAQSAIEATPTAEKEWGDLCDKLAEGHLFKKAKSWIFGANIPGKPFALMFYFGGLQKYAECVRDAMARGFAGFTFTPRN